MAAYLDIAAFKLRTVMPGTDVDSLDALQSGWITAQLEQVSRWLDARLMKRYSVPFSTPPEIVLGWVARIVTFRCYQRRGWDPSDPQAEQIKEDSDAAMAEVKEAADSVTGLYDLPLAATGASLVSKGGPLSYSEQSPYAWMDVQAEIGRNEDSNGGGTYG